MLWTELLSPESAASQPEYLHLVRVSDDALRWSRQMCSDCGFVVPGRGRSRVEEHKILIRLLPPRYVVAHAGLKIPHTFPSHDSSNIEKSNCRPSTGPFTESNISGRAFNYPWCTCDCNRVNSLLAWWTESRFGLIRGFALLTRQRLIFCQSRVTCFKYRKLWAEPGTF